MPNDCLSQTTRFFTIHPDDSTAPYRFEASVVAYMFDLSMTPFSSCALSKVA